MLHGPRKNGDSRFACRQRKKTAKALLESGSKQVCLRCPNRVSIETMVPIVKEYKHVGYYISTQQVNNKDVYFRIGKAKDSMAEMGSKVLGNPQIKDSCREKFALIPVAKMLSNASLWCNLSDMAMSALDTAYNNVYRIVYLSKHNTSKNNNHVKPISNIELYEKHPFVNVMARIRARRLRLLARILSVAPPELRAMLQHTAMYPCTFAREIQNDLVWLFESREVCEDFDLPCPNGPENLFIWHHYIVSHPVMFTKYVKQSENTDRVPLVLAPTKEKDNSMVQCPHCEKVMEAFRLQGHLTKVHRHRNPVKPFVAGSICVMCLRNFQTRAKLCNHLCYQSKKCFNVYTNCMPKLSEEEFKKEEMETASNSKALRHQGRSQLYSPLPTVRIPGPLLEVMYQGRARKCKDL